jgi:sterol desaturase/sphingolipid hydroxylase (fatty acid hydroxylase superfamily)
VAGSRDPSLRLAALLFNGARIHPIEVLVSGCIENLPLLLLGVPAEVLALRFVMGRAIGRFQHCNLDVRLGPLDYLFSSPLNHRWHHSRDLSEAAHNYGGDVIIWDHVFRTFYLPTRRSSAQRRDRHRRDARLSGEAVAAACITLSVEAV